jgi:hypothetical protein
MAYNAFSAPMALVYANEKLVGWATDIQGTERRTNVPVNPLGTVYTQQFCTTLVQVSMSVGKVYIKEESLSAMGVFVQGSSDTIVLEGELNFVLYDKIKSQPVMEVRGAKAAGRTYSLQRGGIMTEGANYDARELYIHPNTKQS